MPGPLSDKTIDVLINPNSAVWISCGNADNETLIARLSSISMIDSETIRCYIPAKFAEELQPFLSKNTPVAALACCTVTLDSYQVKGRIDSVRKLSAEEIPGQKNMLELFSVALLRLGFSPPVVYNAYIDDEFTAVSVKVDNVFDQTPRNGSGFKISG